MRATLGGGLVGAERGGAAWGGGVILTPRDIALGGEGASSWTDPLDPIFSVRFSVVQCLVTVVSSGFCLLRVHVHLI